MKKYLRDNLTAYEYTAEEFQKKKQVRAAADKRIATAFKSLLNDGDKVLELGTGSGQLSKLLSEKSLDVDAIEFSPKMAELASVTAPNANIIVDEFLRHDFGDTKYHGIIGIAFVHLFEVEDAGRTMSKVYDLLLPGGVLQMDTTVHTETHEGFFRKTNFDIEAHRFRRRYSIEDFEALFIDSGFTLLSTSQHDDGEVSGKRWVEVVAKKET